MGMTLEFLNAEGKLLCLEHREWKGGVGYRKERHPDKMEGFCCKLLLFLVQAKLNLLGFYVSLNHELTFEVPSDLKFYVKILLEC